MTYKKPGAYSTEKTLQGVPGLYFRETCVAIVGEVEEQYEVVVDENFLPGALDIEVTLDYDRIREDSEVVTGGITSPPLYIKDIDYTIDYYNGKITCLSTGSIPVGSISIYIDYEHLPTGFYDPKDFYDYDDLTDLYGESLDADGNIVSPLVLSAQFVFSYAPWVKAFPVDPIDPSLGDDDPSKATVDDSDFQRTIEDQCTRFEDIDLMVCLSNSDVITGASGIMEVHIESMNSEEERKERIWITSWMYNDDNMTRAFGDGTYDLNMNTNSHPRGIENEAILFICPCGVTWYNFLKEDPKTGIKGYNVKLEGYYLASAFAGRAASYNVQMPLTKKKLGLFEDISEVYTPTQANTLASKGVTIIDKYNWGMEIRHSLNTCVDSIEQEEFSVVRAKHYMVRYLRKKLEDKFVGQVINRTTYLSVASMTKAMLMILEQNEVIFGYQNIKTRPDPLNPTTIIVRFEYCPSYPLNYILIEFSINSRMLESATASASAKEGTLTEIS